MKKRINLLKLEKRIDYSSLLSPLLFLMFVIPVIANAQQNNNASSQVFKADVVEVGPDISHQLNHNLLEYQVIELDIQSLDAHVKSSMDRARFDLQIGNQPAIKFDLQVNEMRSVDYRSIRSTDTGIVEQDRMPCFTFKGQIDQNPDQMVRLTIMKDQIKGIFRHGGKNMFIEPLSSLISTAVAPNQFVVYDISKIAPIPNAHCGVTKMEEINNQMQLTHQQGNRSMMTCLLLEVATDADWEWFQMYGANSNAEIITNLNMVEGVYQTTFMMDFEIVFQNVWETSADPYTDFIVGTEDSGDVLPEIRAAWNTDIPALVAVDRDVVHMFSAKNYGGLLGSVNGGLPGICTTDPDVAHGFTVDRVGAFLTTAHEIGHNFNGVHGDGTGCGAVGASIMCQGLEKSLFFSAASQTTIGNYITANGACLEETMLNVSCPPGSLGNIDCDDPIPVAATTEGGFLVIGGSISGGCDPMITSVDVIVPPSNCDGRFLTRTYTIADATSSFECVQILTINPTPPPTIICPATRVVTCISDFTPNANDATAMADCTTPTISVSGPVLDGPPNEPADCNGATYTVTYEAEDECGRTAECTQQVAIVNNPPTIVCDANVTIECEDEIIPAMGDATVTTACATLGSTVTWSAPVRSGQPNCDFTTYMVTYTGTDDCGRQASCVRTFTIDNADPVLMRPADAALTCEDDHSPAGPAGMATATASCDLGVVVTFEDESDVTVCDGGTILRTWTATDDCGRSVSDLQTITVDPALAPAITFCPGPQNVFCPQDIVTTPEDVVVDYDCGLTGQVFVSGPVRVGAEGCPGTTYTYTYTAIDECGRSDACQQLFTIIEGGDNVGPTIDVEEELIVDCFEAINPNPDWAEITTGCGNLIDATVEVTDPVYLGFAGPNCPNARYRVTYTVTDACNRSASVFQNYTIQNDGPTMACPDNCEVFSCYDGDYRDIIEAWINTVTATSSCSDDLIVNNTYTQSGGFLNGTCITNGTTPVTFWAYDECGRYVECNSLIIIADDDAPDVYVQPEDQLIPCTANTDEIYAAWLADNGGAQAVDACGGPVWWQAFPNQSLDCEGGPQSIEVDFVVTDNCGNSTTVSATFNTKLLPLAVNVAGLIQTEAAEAVSSVQVAAYQSAGMTTMDISNDAGDYSFEELPYEDNTEIVPSRNDDYLNGLTTYDLILLQMHILGVNELNSPYKRIAADANRSGSISTLDLVLLRRLILHIDEELEDNTSWRFVDANYVFPNPQNPFIEDFPEVYSLTGLEEELADFIAVKIGDLNLDAQTNSFSPSEDRSSLDVLKVQTEDQLLRAGQEYEVALSAANFEAINGFQFTLNFDRSAVEILDIQSADLSDFGTQNYGMSKVNEGAVTISWNSNEAQSISAEDAIFSVVLRAQRNVHLSEVLTISSSLTKAEAYRNFELMNVDLTFLESGLETAYKHFKLFQNQPNPFMDMTTIGFILPEAGEVTLEIYDATGKIVYMERNDFAKGYQQIDLSRDQLPTGVLYYKVSTAQRSASRRMLLLE